MIHPLCKICNIGSGWLQDTLRTLNRNYVSISSFHNGTHGVAYKFVIKVHEIAYSCNLMNCSTCCSYPTTYKVPWIIFDNLLHYTAKNRVVNYPDWNQPSGFAMCRKKTNSHFLPCRSCWNSIEVNWRVQLKCDAVFMTSSPSSSVISRPTLKSRLSDSNYTYEKHVSVVESAFTFSFSPIPQL